MVYAGPPPRRKPSSARPLSQRAQALPGGAIYYFGIGSETPRTEPRAFYILHQQDYRFEPRLVLGAGRRVQGFVGGAVRHVVSGEDRPTLATAERPYGFGSFTAVGGMAGVELDGRDDRAYPVRGVSAQVTGRYFPAWTGDMTEGFGIVEGPLR